MIIYADDTTFYENRDSGQEFVGIGCLILDQDMSNEIVSNSLELLRNDPDINKPKSQKQDQRTLGSKYFHACDDSPNAHSHLCTTIKSKLIGNFQYSYTKNSVTQKDFAWKQCLQYLAVILTAQNSSPIKFFIEQRVSVSEKIISDIFWDVINELHKGSYDHYAIPKFYPKIEINIADKTSAGIQIVDFITWVKNRSHFKIPDTKWEERLGFTSKSTAGTLGGDIYQGDIVFGKGVRSSSLNLYPLGAFPLEDFAGNDEIVQLYSDAIETVINFLYNNPNMKNDFKYIWDKFESLEKDIIAYKGVMSSPVIEEISLCYLTLFDSVPLYKDVPHTDFESYKRLLKTKRLCALTLRKDLINGVRTRSFLSERFKDSIKISQ